MAGPRTGKLTAPLLALLVLANGGAAPGDDTRTRASDWPAGRSGGSRVVVFLKEQCFGDHGEPTEDFKDGLYRYMKKKGVAMPDVDVSFLPKSAVCESKSRGLSAILDALAQDATRALIGSLGEDLCDVTSRLADMWGKPLLSWSCPQVTRGTQRLVPSLEETANAIVAVAKTLAWRSIVIITSDVGWWPVLANKIEVGLQELGIAPRHLYWENQSLRGLHSAHARVIILCASLRSSTGETILQAIDSLKLSQAILLAIDVSSFIPFLPRIVNSAPREDILTEEAQNDDPGSRDFSGSPNSEEYTDIKISLPSSISSNNVDITVNRSIGDPKSNNPSENRSVFRYNSSNYSSVYKSDLIKIKIKLVLDNIRNISREKFNSTHFYDSKMEASEMEPLAGGAAEGSIASDVNFTITDYHKNNNRKGESFPIDTQSGSGSEQYGKYFESSTGLTGRDSPGNSTERRASSVYGQNYGTLNAVSHKKTKSLSESRSDGSFRGGYNDRAVSEGEAGSGAGESPPWRSPTTEDNTTSNNIALNEEYPHFGFLNDSGGDFNTIIQIGTNFTAELRNHLVFKKDLIFERLSRTKRSWSENTYEMFENISIDMKRSFMILTSMDSNNSVSDVFMEKSSRNELFEHILEGLHTVTSGNADNKTVKVFKFLFLDWKEEIQEEESSDDEMTRSHWRPLIILQSTKNMSWKHNQGETFQQGEVSLNILRVQPNFDEWFQEKRVEFEDDSCYGDFCIRAQIKVNSTQIIIIVSGALLFCGLTIGIALIVRNVLLKKRLSKGPNKIVLTATDFVFPQVPDSRRVDEGIEAMLCCWLQQLQEFGGPEVDKPDLLKGSVGSLGGVGAPGAHKGPSSNGSLARNNFIMDHRIRYNGDLVQVKNLPVVGTFELKSKAMDCLILTHGLRHENLNPFIGCLTDPTRPALVHEHCSRGSLEDVLMMDEIKLDWSFRLSLLTDLVRGMKYLHSTPLKVHGNLTSRNCVIDARWVLKVTDYGLPAFYEAQGIPAPAKTSRDLLWTAPELLRHCGLRRRGTQPGDVYSFGIIMQEVVVRGEPFCMLALSSEEIIEKVKKPPPLIRPSVSKGAAPPEAIHIMRQCWTEQAEMRPDFPQVHDLFRKLNHGRKVNFVDTMFQMLEKYSNNLEELIRERTEQLDMEKKKTEQLLNRMLPSYVADKLKLGMPVDPEEFSEVSIYFSDIVGFTSISAHCTPFQVVDLLNDLYTCFDATINAYNVYKVETIGDAYMVVGGLPVRVADHAEQIATMALDLLHQSGRFKIRHLPRTPLHLRIGLHTGPCCAGVVGLTMPRYCLFGDTVNTASRMESTGSAWRIHLSQTTRDKLEAAGGYALEYRGRTEVKGKGKMPTYWLLGKAGFDKKLPTPPPLGLEESLMIDRNPSPRLEELTSSEATGGQVSPCPPNGDFEKPFSNHFSIDKTFFSVEKPCSPSPSPIDNNSTNHDNFLPRVINGERKKPKVMETPNNSQDQAEPIIPTITTQLSEDQVLDQISKAELPITNILHHNKLQIGVSQLPQYTLGTPVSASEVAAALLGSSTSLVSNRYKDISKYKRSLMIEAHDLSTPYNHYRCLSPSDSNIHQLSHGKILGEPRQNAGRLLKRQFSLDRADDSGSAVLESNLASQSNPRIQPRLCKQNSAGAAPDLERIEEVPLVLTSPKSYKRRLETTATFPSSSKSISTESLVIAQR